MAALHDEEGSMTSSSDIGQRKVLLWAIRSLIGVWLFGTASVAWVWYQSSWYVFHPHYLPLTLLFLGLVLSTVAALCCCTWQIVRGPKRWQAATFCLVALVPMGLWCQIGMSANTHWSRRMVPNTFTMRAAKVLGATFMRLEADFHYRRRIESDRIVMYYDPYRSPYVESVDRPAEDLAAMDEHLARLESLLGNRIARKVFWIRGPLLGREFLSLHGLCLGSAWSPEVSSETHREYRGDRHELAHAALDWTRTRQSDPPYILHEGWAMAQCGDSRLELAKAAFKERAEHPEIQVRDLFGPEWYYRDEGAVYSIGGAFVEFLIRRYDVVRFQRLYVESSLGTVDARCREIFERSLVELEAEFWIDVKTILKSHSQSRSQDPE
ncbi:MAG: hypothetical protein U0941_16270 [Planctomycetaceae bacterium]